MFWFGKSWDPVTDCPDLTGKVALVTGGKLVARQLQTFAPKYTY